MKALVLPFAIAVPLLLVAPGAGDPPESDTEQAFMRAKLMHSQKVLEGLALEDFGMVAKHSNQMKLLSLDAGWQVLQTEEYIRQSVDFRRTTDSLTKAAEKKNLDGALLAYFQLTHSCVECHKYVRAEED